MKSKLYILLGLFIVITISCNKNAVSKQSGTLLGSWEMRSWYGGYSGTGGNNLEAGNGNIYTFTENTFGYYENNILRDSGTYTITQGVNPNTGEATVAIFFNSAYIIPYSIENDALILYFGTVAADGVVNKYVRIANAPDNTGMH